MTHERRMLLLAVLISGGVGLAVNHIGGGQNLGIIVGLVLLFTLTRLGAKRDLGRGQRR